jgi:uncharacterized protein
VDLPGHPGIVRVPARELAPDSDLGDHLVTQAVGELSADEIDLALDAGYAVAECLVSDGLICSAALNLRGNVRIVDATSEMNLVGRGHLIQSSRSFVHA